MTPLAKLLTSMSLLVALSSAIPTAHKAPPLAGISQATVRQADPKQVKANADGASHATHHHTDTKHEDIVVHHPHKEEEPPKHPPPVRCTPIDTVENPSFEWTEYPLLHWNISTSEDVYVYEGAGYGIDGNGDQSSETYRYGDNVGYAAAGVLWAPSNPDPYKGASFTISQMVRVCPLETYQFSVYINVAEYGAPSTDSYVRLTIGNSVEKIPFNKFTEGEYQIALSNYYSTLPSDEYVRVAIELVAAPSAFGTQHTSEGYIFPDPVQVQLDVVSLIPVASADMSGKVKMGL